MMNDSTIQKEKRWVYLIFFLKGILSFPLSILFGAILASAHILIIEGLFQVLFPLVICSILFAMSLYAFKERSIRFALQVFVISLVASILIFMGGSFGLGLLIPIGLFLPLFPLFFLLILSATALFIFKDRPFVSFSIKAFTISFFTVFLIVGAWFMLGAYEHEYGKAISIRKFDAPQGKYAELTSEELRGYPALEKALSGEGCTKFDENNWYCKINPDDWRRTSDFLNKKQCDMLGSTVIPFNLCRKYLFSLDEGLENDLSKGIVSEELRDVFKSKGISLSEDAYIRESVDYAGERFWVVEPQNYPVWKDEGRLNVYDSNSLTEGIASLFKINEKYYEIGFMTP